MNKQAIGQYLVMDRNWWRKHGWLDRLVIRLFRKTINHVCKTVICRGMERGVVGSIAFHELAEYATASSGRNATRTRRRITVEYHDLYPVIAILYHPQTSPRKHVAENG